jgi:eukaryotic-like serine/threonine-protein kinase
MEFVEGKSIETLMLESPGLTIIESLRAVKQALEGLAYAHGKKIIHRDVKPANIMRTSTGLVKLMDFGLAKSLDGKSAKSMIAGTPAYMALEQIRGGELDNRVDLFAIGVTLYELLAGQMPFEGMDRQTSPTPLSDLVPAAPAMLEEMIMASLDNDPNKRPATAQLMIVPIENVLSAVTQVAGGGRAVDRVSAAGGTEIM